MVAIFFPGMPLWLGTIIAVLPLLVLLALVWWSIWRIMKKRRHKRQQDIF